MVHLAIANVTFAEMAIDESEAEILARAIIEVERHYNVVLPSSKHMALLGLGAALVKVYTPRAMFAMGRGKATGAAGATPNGSNGAARNNSAVAVEPWAMTLDTGSPSSHSN